MDPSVGHRQRRGKTKVIFFLAWSIAMSILIRYMESSSVSQQIQENYWGGNANLDICHIQVMAALNKSPLFDLMIFLHSGCFQYILNRHIPPYSSYGQA